MSLILSTALASARPQQPLTELDRQMLECRASIRRLNVEVLSAIDARQWTLADRLDRQRDAVYALLASLQKPAGRPEPVLEHLGVDL